MIGLLMAPEKLPSHFSTEEVVLPARPVRPPPPSEPPHPLPHRLRAVVLAALRRCLSAYRHSSAAAW